LELLHLVLDSNRPPVDSHSWVFGLIIYGLPRQASVKKSSALVNL
jgi:hypothetical protein